jgi:integrase
MAKSEELDKLSDMIVRSLPIPARGDHKYRDSGPGSVRGFAARVTANGAKSFILRYTVAGRERLMTLGEYPTWSVAAARKEAARLRREKINLGIDPLEERDTDREAATVNELCDRYISEHASRKRTGREDESIIRRFVRPAFGSRKVAAIAFADVDRLHRKVTAESGPYQANRAIALLSKMFSLSIRWGMRGDNPARGIERNVEERRYRYLDGEELGRLIEALGKHSSKSAANAVRLLLLTGARRGEVMAATWKQFDLEAGIWTKPSSHTKTKREHRVPLSDAAQQLLIEMKADADQRAKEQGRLPSPFLFPGRDGTKALSDLKTSWITLCKAAGLEGVRLHDLRHTYASVLVSAGHSLPIIGALLGHTTVLATSRYSHLALSPLKEATDKVGAIVTGKVVPMPSRSGAER